MKDSFYDTYWKKRGTTRPGWTREQFNFLLSPLLKKSKILDYGCGIGHKYRSYLLEYVDEYVGADVSDVAIDSVNSAGGIGLLIDPATSGVFSESDYFDGAVCSEVFEHLFDPLAAAVEIFRLLKPGSPLVATVPNFGYHPWRIQALLRARVPDEPENPIENPFNGVHIRYFSAWTLKRLLTYAGFLDVKVDTYIKGSIWDIFRVMGPLSCLTVIANLYFPSFLHFRFLSDVFPGLFAERLRVVGYKPKK